MHKVFVSWSGGKDSCLALYRATRGGFEASCLVNMVTEDGQRSHSHGLSAAVLQAQSQALGIPLIQRPTTKASYEAEFKNTILDLKQQGITGGVFGDIDFNAHREWIERVCRETGITPYLPLWEERHDILMKEFIGLGFKAVVVVDKADIFDEEMVGRAIDHKFVKHLEELGKTKNITLCGEAGEYHSFVIDGPIFKQRVEILESRRTSENGYRFLEILKVRLKNK